ncbi:glycosyltransferase family 4 protein [Roseivirga sp.]|uniref:glycosyltransferase family 4 protein n=1 Tax=Roseivirga sp. TaxID=1964215 RepID=UPI002B27AAA1|nr:glycosyltransferase family 4 protein [Roseivirga sp.]
MSLSLLLNGQFAYFQSVGFNVEVGSAAGPEIEHIIQKENVLHHQFPFSREISPLSDLKALFLMIRFLRNNSFDIVHTHTPKAGLIGMMAAWFCNVPVRMHTVAGLPLMEAKGFKRRVLILVERITYRCATKVYPNSFAQREYIRKNIFSNREKLKVIGNGSSNGINCDYFQSSSALIEKAKQIRSELKIPFDKHVAIFVGRVTGDKGINELVNAFKTFQDLHLILVGPLESELSPLETSVLKEIEGNPKIHLVGFQSDVRPYILASSFLVFPSYREGFPNAPMQAGAMGIPCIVSDINGCNEIIINEANGLLIPPKNVEAIRIAILRLVEEPTLRDALKQKARGMIVERYDQKFLWEALHIEYQDQIRRYVH